MICFGGFTLMYLITSHTSKNRSVSANETLSQKRYQYAAYKQCIRSRGNGAATNQSSDRNTHQPGTFFVADIDNELDYVFR